MFGECHAHIIMDGENYRHAVSLHADEVQDDVIRRHFQKYVDRQIFFIRDGGDSYGVSLRAKHLASEFGMDYRTPVFAIHRKGRYGSIVGRGFEDLREFHQLVLEAKAEGADFIKIMTTGILDFRTPDVITDIPLELKEVKEMVHIAHEEGFAVMSHTNGSVPVQIALEAGVDSIEHGNYMDEATVKMLADTDTVWVPTLVTVRNLLGCGRFPDESVREIMGRAENSLRLAWRYGAAVAAGSDAGAYMVPHGQGLLDEVQAIYQILEEDVSKKAPVVSEETANRAEIRKKIDEWLQQGEETIHRKFRYIHG